MLIAISLLFNFTLKCAEKEKKENSNILQRFTSCSAEIKVEDMEYKQHRIFSVLFFAAIVKHS